LTDHPAENASRGRVCGQERPRAPYRRETRATTNAGPGCPAKRENPKFAKVRIIVWSMV
jgi:hypothetical protein